MAALEDDDTPWPTAALDEGEEREFMIAAWAANEGLWPTSERRPALPLPPMGAGSPEVLLKGATGDVASFIKALPPRWLPEEQDFLDLVRSEFATELKTAPAAFLDAYGERRLLRFLRQSKSSEKALEGVSRYLAWRIDEGVDVIRQKIEDGLVNPRDWPNGDLLLDRACIAPCSTSLFDAKGNALCIEQYGCWPAHRLRDLEVQGYMDFHFFCLEYKMTLLERIALARERHILEKRLEEFKKTGLVTMQAGWGEIPRLCTIFDQTGLTLAHALLPCGFRLSKVLISTCQKFYPWLQDTTHITNAPITMATVLNWMKPILPKRTQEKIMLHGFGGDNEQLLKCIRAEYLPTALGGSAVCPEMEPPPTPEALDEMQKNGRSFLRSCETASSRVPTIELSNLGVDDPGVDDGFEDDFDDDDGAS